MTQKDHDLAGKIIEHLNHGADGLDRGTRERLRSARQAALARYQEQLEPAWGFARAGHAAVQIGRHRFDVRYLVATALLVFGLLGVAYWQKARNPASDIAEIDAGLLADDLPINAYLDRGFDSWLKRSSH